MFVYAALGDSITYGQNASSVERTYPCRVISMLNSKGIQAKQIVIARPGWTSADLAEALDIDPYPLRFAKTVSVWVGGDDLIRYGLQLLQDPGKSIEGMIYQYERRLGAMLSFIRAMGPCDVICCTQYNPFPNSPIAVKGIGMLNRAITGAASKTGCRVARADLWFSGNEPRLIDGYRSGNIKEIYLGSKAVHPNDNGHSVIATGLFPLIYSERMR
jgi:lysophospholipase L1-like esterase